MNCKNSFCENDESEAALEASGYCFDCAEELAVLLAEEGFDASSAWKG